MFSESAQITVPCFNQPWDEDCLLGVTLVSTDFGSTDTGGTV